MKELNAFDSSHEHQKIITDNCISFREEFSPMKYSAARREFIYRKDEQIRGWDGKKEQKDGVINDED